MMAKWIVALAGAAMTSLAAAQLTGEPAVDRPPSSPVNVAEERTAEEIYAATCSACHAQRLQGGQGPSLLAAQLIHGSTPEALFQTIKGGVPEKGMPAFGDILADSDITKLVTFIQDERQTSSPEYQAQQDQVVKDKIAHTLVRSEAQTFKLEIVANVGKPWGLAFLPDGRLLVTEVSGGLRVIEKGKLVPEPIGGTPQGRPTDIFKRVLLDVAVHPDYARNGWIYLTAGDSVTNAEGKSNTVLKIVRGRLRDGKWVDSETILTLPRDTATGRLAFDKKNYLYLSSSADLSVDYTSGPEPFSKSALLAHPAQDLSNPQGKIFRIFDDGRIPPDNPFVRSGTALATIWSYGHRNPQGLAFDPVTGQLWSTEHGPRGGDELNLIRPGHNYGWPMITYGTGYKGVTFTKEIKYQGMDQPIVNWTPSIGVSAIRFYVGRKFAKWDGNLLVGSLVQQELYRIVLKDDHAVLRETLLKDVGRIRDIAVGPDGNIYLALELLSQGLVIRLVPTS